MKHRRRGRKLRPFLYGLLGLSCLLLLFGRSFTATPSAASKDTLACPPAADSRLPAFALPLPAERAPTISPSLESPASSPAPEAAIPCVLNRTDYSVDIPALLAEPLSLQLQADAPQILILHTHGSEAYTPQDEDLYIPSDPYRTEDPSYNMIRVGDELTQALTKLGLQVIHDRSLYDYPSYNGSYTRAQAAIEDYLTQYPSIQLVLDVHRDAVLLEDGSPYKTTVSAAGESCSQIMLCVGTDGSGLSHPHWRENLKLALHLQEALTAIEPELARPISLVNSRYNQNLTPGSLIVEIGYNGNSLQEALAAARCFAKAAGSVCQALF